ncbi:MAG: hypothetical protein HY290_14980 [Planctomycetia bacterium]|nr:hypothetical protein [Planctomycetia bacterium]
MELLEERRLLSFSAGVDGAYIVENRAHGSYVSVAIQPGNQAIVAAGFAGTLPNGTISRFGVERYDSLGNVDASYGNAGLASPTLGPGQGADALTLQPDGKAVVVGDTAGRLGLARLNVDGSPDASFGSGGWTAFDIQPGSDVADAVGLQSTGKIVVAGYSNSTNTMSTIESAVVARVTASGAIDSGTGGFGQVNGTGKNAVPAGYTLTSFGPKTSVFTGLAVQPLDDKLVAVGEFVTSDNSSERLVVARYTSAGKLDKTFNGSGYTVLAPAGISSLWGHSVALQTDGKIVVAGGCTDVDGSWDMLIARFNANGTLDTSFGGGSGYIRVDADGAGSVTTAEVNGLAIQPDGKIVAAGWERAAVAGAPGSVMVARLNTDGTLDATFGASGIKLGSALPGTGTNDFRGQAVALQSDDSIIVAGLDYTGSTGSTAQPLLMRFFGTSSPRLAAAPLATGGTASTLLANGAVTFATNGAAAGPLDMSVPIGGLSQPASNAIQVGGTVASPAPEIDAGNAGNLPGEGDLFFDSLGTNLVKGRNRR